MMDEIKIKDLFLNKLQILWKMHPEMSFGALLEEICGGDIGQLKSDQALEERMNKEIKKFYDDIEALHLTLEKGGKIIAKVDFNQGNSVKESAYMELDLFCQEGIPDVKKIFPNQRLLTIHMFEEENMYQIRAEQIRNHNSLMARMIYDASVICQIEYIGEKLARADVEKIVDNYVDDVKEYEGDEIKEILTKFIKEKYHY